VTQKISYLGYNDCAPLNYASMTAEVNLEIKFCVTTVKVFISRINYV